MCSRNPLVTLGVGLRILTSLAQPSLHLSRKIILAKAKFDAPKCNPSQEISDLTSQISLLKMSLVLRLPRDIHLCRSSSNAPHLPSFLQLLQNLHVLMTFARCSIHCACLDDATSKSGPNMWSFTILTWTCASHHNGVHFSTSELNFQKCSEHVVLLAF